MLYCLKAVELNLTLGKPFVKKQYNVFVFSFVSAKSVEVPTELSENCCCDLKANPHDAISCTQLVSNSLMSKPSL